MIGNKQIFKPVNIYFALWCLYRLQGPLYPSGSIVAKIILMLLLVWSMIMMFKVIMHSRRLPSYLQALSVFLLSTTLYGLMLILSGQELYITEDIYIKTSNFDYLKNIYSSLLPIFVFFEYSRRGEMTMRNVVIFTVVLLVINILCFFHDRSQAMIFAIQSGRKVDGFTLNIGYKFLALFPLILLFNRKPLNQYLMTIITLLFVILCMKRGAILIALICFPFLILSTLKTAKGRQRWLITILSVISLLVATYIIINLLSTNDYFVHRIEQTLEGDSSNRDKIYYTFLNHFFSETNAFRFFLGNGANATLKIGMNYAHNDWLEIAINNGLLGIIIYLWYYIALLLDYFKTKKYNKHYGDVIMMAFIIMLASSLFSMSYSSMDRELSIVLGFVLAQLYTKKNENNLFYR